MELFDGMAVWLQSRLFAINLPNLLIPNQLQLKWPATLSSTLVLAVGPNPSGHKLQLPLNCTLITTRAKVEGLGGSPYLLIGEGRHIVL